ncbi:MAG: hypothetical protein HUU06_09240 [Planctomycetaceae bacterium]|nr:DUF4926 domain-containing protein [Planctomycetota bacterium]NUN52952.1 hypothetical protein [Planctomycetaceae bacterium]
MSPAHINAQVRLKEAVEALGLTPGDRGVVVSVWLTPGGFSCEVEFPGSDRTSPVRAFLRAEQLEVIE